MHNATLTDVVFWSLYVFVFMPAVLGVVLASVAVVIYRREVRRDS